MTSQPILRAAALAVFASMAGVALAQTPDTTGIAPLNDRIDDIQRDVAKDVARGTDVSRFGNPDFRPGLSGSASLSYAGQSGNNKAQDFTAGARIRFAQGQMVQTIGFAVDYADAASVKSKQDVFLVYDANYYFTDSLYGFVLGRAETNGLATTASETATDAFLGFGPGYRIINTEQMTWRVQAGIGESYLEDGAGGSETEMGVIASSRLFYAFNESVFLSDDMDALKTNSALRLNNDFGINFKMNDMISTRVSYLTKYNDSRAIRSDNKLGVSIVFGF
jgi:putative salt-induced outer membrane protein